VLTGISEVTRSSSYRRNDTGMDKNEELRETSADLEEEMNNEVLLELHQLPISSLPYARRTGKRGGSREPAENNGVSSPVINDT